MDHTVNAKPSDDLLPHTACRQVTYSSKVASKLTDWWLPSDCCMHGHTKFRPLPKIVVGYMPLSIIWITCTIAHTVSPLFAFDLYTQPAHSFAPTSCPNAKPRSSLCFKCCHCSSGRYIQWSSQQPSQSWHEFDIKSSTSQEMLRSIHVVVSICCMWLADDLLR